MKKKTKLPSRKPVGRPPVVISDDTWKQINYSLEAGCDGASIARQYGMHPDTLRDRIVDKYGDEYGISDFSAYAQLKKAQGLDRLRRRQMDTAMSGEAGSVTMQIWLGKQLLGQKDQIEQTITVPQVNVHPLNEQEQQEISTALIAIEQHESNDGIHEESESGSGE